MLLRRVVAGWPGGQGTAGIGLGGSAGGGGAGLGTDGGGRPPGEGVHGNRGRGDMDLAPGDGRPPRGGESHTAIISGPDGPWDLVDRPQEARGGSVLVPAKANNRSAGFCQFYDLS